MTAPASDQSAIEVAFVDDDPDLRDANAQALRLAGFAAIPLASAQAALDRIGPGYAGVVVTDVRMPGMDGIELFRRLRALDADIPVVVISGHADVAMAVEAMSEGAYDFIAKPYSSNRLAETLRRAVEKRALVLENRRLRSLAEAPGEEIALLGEAPAIIRLRQTIRDLADVDVDVLVLGETGTGKEVVANLLHQQGRRRSKPFVALNCGALPESVIESELFGYEAGAFTGAQKKRVGRIEHSSGGTLFLDELESMPPAAQVKLLRVLEGREISPLGSNERRRVDLRVVAATKLDLGDPAQRGDFREDLFYRLNVVTLRIPPLRERRRDVPLLFAQFLARAARKYGRDVPALDRSIERHLVENAWTGNVRELVHFAERVALGVADMPVAPVQGDIVVANLPERLSAIEANLIREALEANRGDVRATLETLGIPRKTFYDKLARHGIDRVSYVVEE
ncbi:sigma-54 dependent transcriptional regulator [Bosea sp. (in: a-proteobacteria)]|jgi:two-component system C4-dicarboxylate transport response regulator DctD|uniref:sigma-54-dependent transcriptional regulator n=1 Tax=Bosea sp. (in: a-proteobacteria) TaxID=1871050 RepID=UPI002DDCB136|nr:sigma-54 dependent transcriptional regulator [Bosea sp. (in: a-proteobacteria)]HEV2508822.1 sigma-54 dependent transcriptional regulator [Bosea sp. (in: a-proteobacteria)]